MRGRFADLIFVKQNKIRMFKFYALFKGQLKNILSNNLKSKKVKIHF
jgi:hypothetical protein